MTDLRDELRQKLQSKDDDQKWMKAMMDSIMNQGKIPVTLEDGATCPTRGSPDSAGLDLYALKDTYIGSNATLVSTGVHMAIPKGHVGLIRSRSGMAYKRNIFSEAGVIDADYRGAIQVLLYYKATDRVTEDGVHSTVNRVDTPLVKKGDRIAQLLIVPVNMQECYVAETLDDTVRGAGGFGSTGN